MFDRLQLERLRPLLLFFMGYTTAFLLFAMTLGYTFPFLAGFLLAAMLQPAVRGLRNRLGCSSGPASFLVTSLAFVLLLGILFLLGFWLACEISNLMSIISEMDLTRITGPINTIMAQISEYLNRIDSNFIRQNQEQLMKLAQTGMKVASSVLEALLKFLTSLPAILTMFLVMVFSTYFFSKDMPRIKKKLTSLLSGAATGHLRFASQKGISVSGKLFRSYLMLYFVTFLETLVVLLALRMPYPLVLSLVAGFADILPVLGPGAVYLPLALVQMCQGRFLAALALLICWMLISAVRQILEPRMLSNTINVHPLCMLAAIYFALIAGSVWVLLYMSGLFVLYQVFTGSGALPRLFEQDKF